MNQQQLFLQRNRCEDPTHRRAVSHKIDVNPQPDIPLIQHSPTLKKFRFGPTLHKMNRQPFSRSSQLPERSILQRIGRMRSNRCSQASRLGIGLQPVEKPKVLCLQAKTLDKIIIMDTAVRFDTECRIAVTNVADRYNTVILHTALPITGSRYPIGL